MSHEKWKGKKMYKQTSSPLNFTTFFLNSKILSQIGQMSLKPSKVNKKAIHEKEKHRIIKI